MSAPQAEQWLTGYALLTFNATQDEARELALVTMHEVSTHVPTPL